MCPYILLDYYICVRICYYTPVLCVLVYYYTTTMCIYYSIYYSGICLRILAPLYILVHY
jgi:hypothetical protein